MARISKTEHSTSLRPPLRPAAATQGRAANAGPARCRRKFLKAFPEGFQDETYLAWERNYKWAAHRRWIEALGKASFEKLLREKAYSEIANTAAGIEGRTHLIFSYEKMALRDAIRLPEGARGFAEGLFNFLHGDGSMHARFDAWRNVVAELPRKQSRVLTWPNLTVFGFLAQPKRHIYLKPNVLRRAADAYGFGFDYRSKPEWPTYASLLKFAETVVEDLADMGPRDMIDIQSFLWVQGSDEY